MPGVLVFGQQTEAPETKHWSTITVWLMPNEPAADDLNRPYDRKLADEIDAEIAKFLRRWGDDQVVTVLNASIPSMREQLVALNRHFVTPFWPVINGQRKVLEELEKFAKKEGVKINVRFVDWTPAFDEIRTILENPDQANQPIPDIVQIGSTWRSYFAHRGLRQAPVQNQQGNVKWKAPGQQEEAGTLPFTLDARLLYYWHRMMRDETNAAPLKIDTTSWDTLVTSLDAYVRAQSPAARRPPIVMPILANTSNVLHDYVPLIWAGGGEFLRSSKIDLSSPSALRVPYLISQFASRKDNRGTGYRLFAFPEASHYEANALVIRGYYGGCIEPVAFLPHFYREFAKLYPGKKFEDYVTVAVPPSTFLGGSDLMITHRARSAAAEDQVFAVARFLAAGDYAHHLAELGATPVQVDHYGTPEILKPLDLSAEYKQSVTKTIGDAAGHIGRQYPPSPNWPTYFESQQMFGWMHELWQLMSEGASYDRLKATARTSQQRVNEQTDMLTKWRARAWELFPILATLAAVVCLFACAREYQNYRRLQRVLDWFRRIRGFAAAACASFDASHEFLHRTPNIDIEETKKDKQRANIIQAGLAGWDYASDDSKWDPALLKQVVWEAVMVAIDPSRDLLREWNSQSKLSARALLESYHLHRTQREPADGCPRFFFDVSGMDGIKVLWPPMLEHVLTCLLQNALKATESEADYHYPIDVLYDRHLNTLSVITSNAELSASLCRVINTCHDMPSFSKEVDRLLQGPVENRPGLGLVEAFAISTVCYGGLTASSKPARFDVKLKN